MLCYRAIRSLEHDVCRYEDDDEEGGAGGGGADGPQLVGSSWLDEHYKKRSWQV